MTPIKDEESGKNEMKAGEREPEVDRQRDERRDVTDKRSITTQASSHLTIDETTRQGEEKETMKYNKCYHCLLASQLSSLSFSFSLAVWISSKRRRRIERREREKKFHSVEK